MTKVSSLFALLPLLLCSFSLFQHACSFSFSPEKKANDRPIIGILTQPSPPEYLQFGATYLPAAYVKWVESSGGRAVPVPYNAGNTLLQYYFNSLNGLILTGGGLSVTLDAPYVQAAEFFYQKSLQGFKNGDYFPIWGTCQGFQVLAVITAQNNSVLQTYAFDSENLPLPLIFTTDPSDTRVFSMAQKETIRAFEKKNITINLHHDGVDPVLFSTNSNLESFYTLIAMDYDRKHKPFAAMFEGQVYPIYGVQFHPERNMFEWDVQEKVMHTYDAVKAMQYLGDFFMNEARNSIHAFPSPAQEAAALIYNYAPFYTGNIANDTYPDQQTYCFNNL